jgi:hypothetical protein
MSMRTGSVFPALLLVSGIACSADKPEVKSANKASQSTNSAALGSTWADAGKMPDLFTGMWLTLSSFVEADAKLNVPFTATAQKYVDAFKHKRDIPYAQDGCQTPGLPIAMRLGGGLKFTYAPGLISIYMQSVAHTRFIRMNQPQDLTSPKYYGNSIGHWEGDTLVVETEDFSSEIAFQYGVGKPLPPEETRGTFNLGPPPGSPPPGAGAPSGDAPVALLGSLSAAIWGPHSEGMHMVERMRVVDPETLEVKTTIYDDTVWTKPYVTSRNYKRIQKGVREMGTFNGEPQEWVCTVSITTFDPETNTYNDKDPEEMVKYLDKLDK